MRPLPLWIFRLLETFEMCMADQRWSIVERFRRDGFVVIDHFFSPRELSDFAEAFDRLPDFGSIGEKYDACAQMPEFLRLVAKRETVEVINTLLNRAAVAPLYCFTNRCRIDVPHDERRTYGWHQEVFYTIPHGRFVQTWAPLIRDTTVANGTVEVCVGSHAAGIAPQTWTDREDGATQIIVDQATVAGYEQRAIPMKLGQMMFFDGRLFHRSGRNTSTEPRYSMVGMYHDVDAPGFRVPRVQFAYRGQTPRQAYDEHQAAMNG